MGHAIRCRPGQRGGRSALNIRPDQCRRSSCMAWIAGSSPACAGRQRSIVNVLSRWAWGSTRPGSVRAPASPTGRESAGRLGSVWRSGRRERPGPPAAVHRWPASASRRAAPGRESGAADTGERRARGGERHRQSPHRSKTRPGDFAREQQSVIWSLPAFSSAVSTLSRCSGIPSRTPVIQEPHIPCSQESITSTPACCNT